MNISKWLVLATLGVAVVAGSACAQAADDTTDGTAVTAGGPNADVDLAGAATNESGDGIVDQAQAAGEQTADDTKNLAETVGDKADALADAVGSKATGAVSTTGEAITDGWITTRVSARFVDETLLKGSDIDVDTDDHVVTLKGTVGSEAAKARAAEVARSTEGVTRVVNQLVVT